jgi:hypothetical protein
MARLVGIEPTLTVLETAVLPLYDSRIFADLLLSAVKNYTKTPRKSNWKIRFSQSRNIYMQQKSEKPSRFPLNSVFNN